MSNFIDFLLVISKLQSPIYCRSPQLELVGSGCRNVGRSSSHFGVAIQGLYLGKCSISSWTPSRRLFL